jgi:hypothetical protein
MGKQVNIHNTMQVVTYIMYLKDRHKSQHQRELHMMPRGDFRFSTMFQVPGVAECTDTSRGKDGLTSSGSCVESCILIRD